MFLTVINSYPVRKRPVAHIANVDTLFLCHVKDIRPQDNVRMVPG
jgi:hypothetical protein